MNNLKLLFPALNLLLRWQSRENSNPVIASIFSLIICSFEDSQILKYTMIGIHPLHKLNPFQQQYVILLCKYLVDLEEKCS